MSERHRSHQDFDGMTPAAAVQRAKVLFADLGLAVESAPLD